MRVSVGALAVALVIAAVTVATQVHGSTEVNQGKKLVCYFGSWAKYRHGLGTYDVETIDPMLCTHLMFGFAGLRDHSFEIYALDEYNELEENWGRGAYRRFTNLKHQNPNLKVLLAIGGWNEGSEKYSNMARTAENRKKFIDSVIPFLQKQGFDGLDLDWEYPAQRGGRPEDKQNFATLCREMRDEFDKHGYLLTAAVSAGEFTILDSYDVPSISQSLHFINIMAYDFHGAWDPYTGHHAALARLPTESGNDTKLNVKHAVETWLSLGAPREKLILGMGTYGRGFMLQHAEENGLYAPVTGGITGGPYTNEAGFWGYNEICEIFFGREQGQWTIVRQQHYDSPYAFNGKKWMGYDDIESIRKKTQYALDMGLGGGMFWSLETDDFHGLCGDEKNPLIKTASRMLVGPIQPPLPTTPRPSTTVTWPTWTTTTGRPGHTSTHPPADGECRETGQVIGANCATFYYKCTCSGTTCTKHQFNCSNTLVFDANIRQCNWPAAAGCE